MIDPKKRLEEILKKVYGQYPYNAGLTPTKKNHAEAVVEILKEFVHKKEIMKRLTLAEEKAGEQYQQKWDILDNLPSEEEIEKIIFKHINPYIHRDKADVYELWSPGALANAIRKLIEGKK